MVQTIRIIVLIFLFILGIAALYGGWSFITDPTGESINISIEVLDGTPFTNFLIPGILLFVANGLLPLAVAIMTIKKSKYYPWFIIIQGFILIGWLSVEILLNTELFFPVMHYPLYTLGILFIVFGLVLGKNRQAK
jgi:hypothetical protein